MRISSTVSVLTLSQFFGDASGTSFSCPSTYSAGPCFTSAKNWTDAQAICESHGSNLVSVVDATTNTNLGTGGCFDDAPWNDWECTWIGVNDLITEGSLEWASGDAYSFERWGQHEPDTTEGNGQDCGAQCKGGSISGYSGDFWVDLECDAEYPFCCDPSTFELNKGTPDDESFLYKLALAKANANPTPAPVDTNPYADRRLCFSTKQTWADAQTLCKSVGSNLMTIHNQAELDHAASTVHFSRVEFGLDWKCFWSGWSDQAKEGEYTWISKANPAFMPSFGPFEAGNGDGDEQDCVAICKPDCDYLHDHENPKTPNCTDLGEYGYTGVFLIDTECTDEYSFCCDGLAAEYVATENGMVPTKEEEEDRHVEVALGTYAVFATIFAIFMALFGLSKGRQYRDLLTKGRQIGGGGLELSILGGGGKDAHL